MTAPSPTVQLMLAQSPHLRMADGREIALNDRDAALLALLCVQGPLPRTSVIEMLWPDSDAQVSRNRLRQRLFNLRRACGHAVVEGGATLTLAADVGHDLAQAVTLLGSLAFGELAALDDWLRGERQRRFEREREALALQADTLEAAGHLDAALPVAESLLRLDVLSEVAHRRLMRLHYLRGDRSAALLAFDRCAQVMKDEVGTQPSALTMQLLESVQRTVAPAALAPQRVVPASVMRPPRMVGREALRRRVLIDSRGGAVVAIVGEAGMGKSRLLAELGPDLGRMVCAAARPGDSAVPFASFARLLREVVRNCPSGMAAAPRQELARLLPELGPTASANEPGQRNVLEDAVRALVGGIQQTVDALALDDLHFADQASLDMLLTLATGQPQATVRWVVALRPAETGSRTHALLDALAESGRLALATLQPLSAADLDELVDDLNIASLRKAALGEMLHKQSGGNPLFALETIKHLLLDETAMTGPSLTALPHPSSVRVLIERRLVQLQPAALALARVAAVAGIDFTIGIAEFALERPAILLADAWGELEQAQVIRDSAFAHDLVFEAVLQGIPSPIARHTHARVAQYLAEHGGEAARVADHWLQADQPLDALPWLKSAAQVAGQALRSGEQYNFLLQAASIEERAGLRGAAFETLHAALRVDGKYGKGLDLACGNRLAALAATPRERAQAGFVRMLQYFRLLRYDEALEVGQQALVLAEAAADSDLLNEVRQLFGTLLAYMGRNDEAVEVLLPLQAWIDISATPNCRMDYHGDLAAVLDNVGRLGDAMAFHLRAIEQARALERWSVLSVALSNLAVNRLDAGDALAALQHLQEAEQLGTMFEGEEAPSPQSAFTLAFCTHLCGRYKDALAWADEGLRRAQAMGSAALEVVAWYGQARIWIDLGQYARALSLLDAVERATDMPPSFQTTARLLRARAQRWRGEPFGDILATALAELPAGSRPDLRHAVMLERTYCEPPLQALVLTDRVVEEASAIGHQGTVMAALVRRAVCLGPHDTGLAVDAARRALVMAATLCSAASYHPELWLHAAQVMQAAGLHEEAAAQLACARAWIKHCLDSGQVPEPFVESFLYRNPVNREVLAAHPPLRELQGGRDAQ
jgi:DNA-binding SARP family transcriptional activator